MDRLLATNSVPLANADTAPSTGTPQYATDGDPASSTPATQFPAYAWNMIQDEIMRVITGAGLTPDRTNWGQLLAAIQELISAAAPGVTYLEAANNLSDLGSIPTALAHLGLSFSFGTTGWITFPGGFTLQWTPFTTTTAGYTTCNFPKSFATAFMAAWACLSNTSPSSNQFVMVENSAGSLSGVPVGVASGGGSWFASTTMVFSIGH